MRGVIVFILAVVLTACASVAPVPIRAGDICFHCRRTIANPALAAEVISQQGHAFKFSSVVCLNEYVREHPTEAVKATFVTDYEHGKMFDPSDAWFVKYTSDPQIGEVTYAAFRSEVSARAFGAEHKGGAPVRWDAVQADHLSHAN